MTKYRMNAKHECPACGLQMIQQEPDPPSPPWLHRLKPAGPLLVVLSAVVLLSGHDLLERTVERSVDMRAQARVNERDIHLLSDRVTEVAARQLDTEEDTGRHLFQLRHSPLVREPIFAAPDWCCCVSDGLAYTCVHRYGPARELATGPIRPPTGAFWHTP